MRAGGVVVEVEVHVECEVRSWIGDSGQYVGVGLALAACSVEPALGSGEAVAWDEDELLGACFADRVDHCLVVLQDEGSGHVVGFVHYAENYVGVCDEAG